MFSKSSKTSAPVPVPSTTGHHRTRGVPSIISADLRIVGDLICEGDLQVEGVIQGDIKTVTLTVGEQALIKGSLICEHAVIRGKIDGDVFAKTVRLTKTAKIRGDIVHDDLSIEAGAYIDGRCRRLEDEDAQEDIRKLAGPDADIPPVVPGSARLSPFQAEDDADKADREKALETIKKAASR